LIFTGIAVGILAASIDIAGDWLGDVKTGYCKNGEGGGKFYLNKSFCCWGHNGIKCLMNIRPLDLMISRMGSMPRLDTVENCSPDKLERWWLHRGIHFLHSLFCSFTFP
jgi:hypothetical protein